MRYTSHLNAGDRPRVDFDQLAPYEIPLPTKPEQRRIVAEIEKQFSRLDQAVANLKRIKANLKRYKAAVLKAAVEGRLVPTEAELARREGRSYETGAQLLQRVLDARREPVEGKGQIIRSQNLAPRPRTWQLARRVDVGHLSIKLRANPFDSVQPCQLVRKSTCAREYPYYGVSSHRSVGNLTGSDSTARYLLHRRRRSANLLARYDM